MQVDATDLNPKCYMATPARSTVGPSGHALQHYHGAPPIIILRERLGRGRLAAHGLSFSIINKSPGATHKYVFGATLPSISAGTGMGTDGNRVLRIYTRCCLA